MLNVAETVHDDVSCESVLLLMIKIHVSQWSCKKVGSHCEQLNVLVKLSLSITTDNRWRWATNTRLYIFDCDLIFVQTVLLSRHTLLWRLRMRSMVVI